MCAIVEDLYETGLIDARQRFAESSALKAVLSPSADPDHLELFLICFCALGVQMTRPVEDWIDRAGRRCIDVGLPELGKALRAHARHEADHHLMMIHDTETLVGRRNVRLNARLPADALLATPPTPGIAQYVKLHEDVIAGSAPFGQLAIEYEIERLSVEFGGKLLRQCSYQLGTDALEGMSFVTEHVAVDVGHTKFNEAQLGKLLTRSRSFATELSAAGCRALAAYGMFVDDCFGLATTLQRAPGWGRVAS
jgi:hypothetical protein